MSGFYVFAACINAAVLALCIRDRVWSGVVFASIGLVWAVAYLLTGGAA